MTVRTRVARLERRTAKAVVIVLSLPIWRPSQTPAPDLKAQKAAALAAWEAEKGPKPRDAAIIYIQREIVPPRALLLEMASQDNFRIETGKRPA